MTAVLQFVSVYICGPAMPVIIFAAGAYFLIILRGFPLTKPVLLVKTLLGGGGSSVRSLCLALAGTLGVGNIVGVASALAVGGAGAIFWMLFSSLFAMLLKYAEIVLAVIYRRKSGGIWHGGAMYYIENPRIARLFAAICAAASLPLGGLIQVRAAADAVEYAFSFPPLATGILFSIIVLIVICGGAGRIMDFTFRVIPLLTLLYTVMSLAVIIADASALPSVLSSIMRDAFSLDSAAGGIFGFLLSDSMRYGVARGILSNEAGCGTAPIAHAHADAVSPAAQGCWGVFEVFCDTVLLCPLTALALLTSTGVGEGGMKDVSAAFQSCLGKAAPALLAVCISMFALSTVICWAHYGIESIGFLSAKKLPAAAYRLIYSLCMPAGAILNAQFIWYSADILVAVMTVVNTICVVIRSADIREATKAFLNESYKIRQNRTSNGAKDEKAIISARFRQKADIRRSNTSPRDRRET